ncbi:MAG: metallophosphoesterase family protein [Anaerolineaceae bacterium]|nr:metallophosphoesterase family protein [Anaerolineaceae bacterium]
MKIAILSDTHNDQHSLITAANQLREQKIHTIIHCGDLTSPDMIRFLDGFQVIFTYGNCDYLSGQIQDELIMLGTDSIAKTLYTGELEGVKFAAAHGNNESQLNQIIHRGIYTYVFHGHTHHKRDERRGSTRVINPGSLSSRGFNRPTYCILDLASGVLDWIRLENNH